MQNLVNNNFCGILLWEENSSECLFLFFFISWTFYDEVGCTFSSDVQTKIYKHIIQCVEHGENGFFYL